MEKKIFLIFAIMGIYLFNSSLLLAQADVMMYSRENPFYVLINKQNGIGKEYKPDNLVIPHVKFIEKGPLEKKHMQNTAAYYLKMMFDDAARQNIHLVALSGYRSYSRQSAIYNQYIKKYGRVYTDTVSAKPGYSEHQTGLAMDISAKSARYALTQSFAKTKEGKWLAQNAHRHGFIIRYPKGKEAITGYTYEPWHVRYVGQELATYLFINDLSLEEMGMFFEKQEHKIAEELNDEDVIKKEVIKEEIIKEEIEEEQATKENLLEDRSKTTQ